MNNKTIDEVSAELEADAGKTQNEQPIEQNQNDQTQIEEPAQETPVEQPAQPTRDQFETLFMASQAATQKLGALSQENQVLKAQLDQYKAMIEQQSQNTEQNINDALTAPTLDIGELQYMSDDERKAATTKFAQEMAEYNRKKLLSELAPIIKTVQEQKSIAEEQAVIGRLSNDPRYEGFADSINEIREIINRTPALKNADTQTRYEVAYLIDKGLRTKAKKETTEDIVNRVMQDSNALRMLEERRALTTAKQNSAVPAVAASMGTSPATPPSKPKNIDEADDALLKAFGYKR